MTVRPATAGDLVKWFPEGLPCPIQALVLERRGDLLAVGGVAHRDGYFEAFSKVEPEARALPGAVISLGRWAASVADLIETTPGPVFAVTEPSEPTAANLLAWCGFKPQGNGQWRYQPRAKT